MWGLLSSEKGLNQSKGNHLGYEKVQRLVVKPPSLYGICISISQLAFGSLSEICTNKFNKIIQTEELVLICG